MEQVHPIELEQFCSTPTYFSVLPEQQDASPITVPQSAFRSSVFFQAEPPYYTNNTLQLTTKTIDEQVGAQDGIVISYHDITKNDNSDHQRLCKKNPTKLRAIISNASGIFRPGMNAIMGPSGCGKTSLLNIITGHTSAANYTGRVLVNGYCLSKNYSRIIGYVPQDTMLHYNLTPLEHFWFYLRLRGGAKMSKSDCRTEIENMLKTLHLQKCCETKIKDKAKSELSGGERKLVSIGIELLSNPKCFFMDEPTSQLDSTSSFSVVKFLRKYADAGRTIVFTIHQPSKKIFEMIDNLTLIAKGKVVYCGLARNAAPYLRSLGYVMDKYHTHPEFISEILYGNAIVRQPNVSGFAYSKTLEIPKIQVIPASPNIGDQENNNSQYFSPISPRQTTVILGPSTLNSTCLSREWRSAKDEEISDYLHNLFSRSNMGVQLARELNEIKTSKGVDDLLDEEPTQPASFVTETRVLLEREIQTAGETFKILFFLNVVVGLLFGSLYFFNGNVDEFTLQDRLGLFFYLSVQGITVPCIAAGKKFSNKYNTIYRNERRRSCYGPLSFTLSRAVILVLGRALSAFTLSLLVYWMVGLRSDASAFFYFVFTAFSTGILCDCLCFLCTVMFEDFESGKMVLVVYIMLSSVFCGFLLDLRTTNKWIKWIRYLSVTRYAYMAWSVNEFVSLGSTQCKNITKIAPRMPSLLHPRIGTQAKETDLNSCDMSNGFLLDQVLGDDVIFSKRLWLSNAIPLATSVVVLFLVFIFIRRRN